jgi:Predicted thioesterase
MEFDLPTDRHVFTIPVVVQEADIDELNHVNNVVYLRWVQEVATAHWLQIASAQLWDRTQWVVLRHEIDYKSAASLHTEILASTWVGDSIGPRSNRFVKFCDQQTGKVLAQAKTTWCMLDASTGRPKRIEQEITDLLTIKKYTAG